MATPLHHATAVAVALDPDGPLAGALFIGPSGCGKSSLALSLIESCPWRRTALVGDDAVLLGAHDDKVWARAPESIEGLIEARGFGPVRIRHVRAARIIAAFDLARAPPRLPEPQIRDFGASIFLPVWPFETAGVDATRLRSILRSILGGQTL